MPWNPQTVLKDYWTCCLSREVSLLNRREVLTGKAKFGVGGGGKEVAQVALAHTFRKGDFRSGYYRDQTLMFALDLITVAEHFAQLYADPRHDPFSGGRQMVNHFATPFVDADGNWTEHKSRYNISSDISTTAGQMGRALGLALASKLFRAHDTLKEDTPFSTCGNEVCFCTIGDGSTSEGVFWETINAAGVMQVPLAISVWDDGYAISVPIQYQTTKQSISEILSGFETNDKGEGLDIYRINGWDYPALRHLYEHGIEQIRDTHRPALFHVQALTQTQGHSTSGSHERYKSQERLAWEREYDCNRKMRQWMLKMDLATPQELDEIEQDARAQARAGRDQAWAAYTASIHTAARQLDAIYTDIKRTSKAIDTVDRVQRELKTLLDPVKSELVQSARRMRHAVVGQQNEATQALETWIQQAYQDSQKHYHTQLYSASPRSALQAPVIPPVYSDGSPLKNGYEILNACFDQAFERNPLLYAFGEDVGQLGDVNQAFSGLQRKYGDSRIFDTGIREWTIIGQAIGMAMRGLRPIAEIQYLDYLLYGLVPLVDDLATLRYRTDGIQQAPAIIRTRGHRLEGIWHSGSPMGMILNALRGIYILVPRNMTQAAGFYNTMLQSDDPALIVECLNGYRLKERLPDNIGEFTVPLGIPEVLQEGTDLTLVTYGSCVRIAQAGIALLESHGISVELIDVQSLIPFDREHRIVESLKKTNRILFLDEDVPGGASAYMMQQVLETQGGYFYLDSPPTTLTARAHRPPYGSDGNYFSKPNAEDVFEAVYGMIYEANPQRFRGNLSRF